MELNPFYAGVWGNIAVAIVMPFPIVPAVCQLYIGQTPLSVIVPLDEAMPHASVVIARLRTPVAKRRSDSSYCAIVGTPSRGALLQFSGVHQDQGRFSIEFPRAFVSAR